MITIGSKSYKNIKAILLDKDGTLIDIKSLHIPLMERRAKVIASLVKKISYKEILLFWGIDLDKNKSDVRGPFMAASKEEEKIIATTALYRNGIDWREAYVLVQKAYEIDETIDNSPEWNKPNDYVIDFINEASKRNYVLGIATGDTTLRAEEACRVLNIYEKMSEVLGVDKVLKDKPAPDLVLEFCKRTNLLPEEVMIVGDSIKDILMARSAGVGLSVAIESGVTSKKEFGSLANHIISSFEEIKFFDK
jgi:phosphoglycolate phosphatase